MEQSKKVSAKVFANTRKMICGATQRVYEKTAAVGVDRPSPVSAPPPVDATCTGTPSRTTPLSPCSPSDYQAMEGEPNEHLPPCSQSPSPSQRQPQQQPSSSPYNPSHYTPPESNCSPSSSTTVNTTIYAVVSDLLPPSISATAVPSPGSKGTLVHNNNANSYNGNATANSNSVTNGNNNMPPPNIPPFKPQQQRPQESQRSSNTHTTIAESWFGLNLDEHGHISFRRIVLNELKQLLWDLIDFARNRDWKKKCVTVCVVLMSCTVFFDLFFLGNIRRWLMQFLVWMTYHPTLAELAFIVIFTASVLLFVPPTILTFGAGWAFVNTLGWANGIFAAISSCFIGSSLGAILSFFRSRYMMREIVHLLAKRYPIVRAADKALKIDGFRIMLLLRLCPLIPFHGLNYIGGISGVGWETYTLSLIAVLPYQLFVVLMGATTGRLYTTDVTPENEDQYLTLVVVTSVGVACFILALIICWRYTKKELKKELQMGEMEMSSYICSVRRMSILDLYRENDACAVSDDAQAPEPASDMIPFDENRSTSYAKLDAV